MQKPTAMIADLVDGSIDSVPSLGIENTGLRSKSALATFMPAITTQEVRRLVAIVKPIDGTTFVAVEPRTIATEGYEIAQGEFGIVPHWGVLNPSAYADGTDFIANV
jgi:hypothetical protein